MYIATHIFTYLPICLSTYLPIHPSVYLSIYLPACLCSEFVQCGRVDDVLWILYFVCGHLLGLRLRGIGPSQGACLHRTTQKKNTQLCVHAPIVTFVYFRMNCLYCPHSYRSAHLDCLYTPTAPVNLGLSQLARGSVNGIEHR